MKNASEFSDFLLELHHDAPVCRPDELRLREPRNLQRFIPFDFGVWGGGSDWSTPMNIAKRLSDLPPEVLAAIGLFMRRRRWDAGPIVMPEAINTIRVAFPRFQMVKRDLSEAIATAAAARGLSVYFDASQSAAAGAEAERWADDGDR